MTLDRGGLLLLLGLILTLVGRGATATATVGDDRDDQERRAIVSALSTDGFLLPALVLNHRLRKLNSTVPFYLLVTEDVGDRTRDVLSSHGIRLIETEKIESPYEDRHGVAKFQYTKLRLWRLIQFDVVLYIDLDVLPMFDPSEWIECPAEMCAVLRHSEKFNAGVFVLRPDEGTYRSMLENSKTLESYDGGDQGFLNAYFSELGEAPMWQPSSGKKNETTKGGIVRTLRLPTSANYDVGIYYLNGGRALVPLHLIHYTMGPVKPWQWWTYPMFDLNWHWHTARLEAEPIHTSSFASIMTILRQTSLYALAAVLYQTMRNGSMQSPKGNSMTTTECKWLASLIIVLASILVSFYSAFDETTNPMCGWTMFFTNASVIQLILTLVFGWLRSKCNPGSGILAPPTIRSSVLHFVAGQFVFWIQWIGLYWTQSFGRRAYLFLETLPFFIAIHTALHARLLLQQNAGRTMSTRKRRCCWRSSEDSYDKDNESSDGLEQGQTP